MTPLRKKMIRELELQRKVPSTRKAYVRAVAELAAFCGRSPDLISVEELTKPATLATELHFPPGYLRAFRYNLATEMAPEFGVEPSPQVQRIAMTSKRNLKRINNPDDIMSMPYSLIATRQRFNVYAGNY